MPRDSAVADTFEGGDNLNRLFVVLFTKPSGSRDGSATKIYHKAYRSAAAQLRLNRILHCLAQGYATIC